jgi:beta-glucosidase
MNHNQNDHQAEKKIELLLSQLTLKEKVSLLSGKDNWFTVPIERLEIPSLVMTDGPHGVRSEPFHGRIHEPATAFPTGVSLAATWNPDLIRQVGVALAEETLAMGCDILLGPCVNIVRHPLAGRNFESYSEDPFLAGRIGTAWVQGLQSKNVGASLKHYACNNQEFERGRGNSIVDERTLREIYLAQFEMIVKNANPWTVMCSYNRINDVYASENNHLLNEILKGEWKYDGVVISDWGANHTIVESVQGGLDIEMPGPAKYYGGLLVEAVNNWQIDEAKIDEAVRRILRMIFKSGKLDNSLINQGGKVNTHDHQNLARQVAEEAITLLKNEDHILPLVTKQFKKIAIIGPGASDMQVGAGGSSYVEPPYRSQPIEALKRLLAGKVEIKYEQGCDHSHNISTAKKEIFRSQNGTSQGLEGQYYSGTEFTEKPLLSRIDKNLDFWWLSFAPLKETPDSYSVRWTGQLIPQFTGRHTLILENSGQCRLWIDGKLLIENSPFLIPHSPTITQQFAICELTEGKVYDLKVEFIRNMGLDFPHIRLLFGYTPLPEQDDRFQRAVELAKVSDVAIIFAGYPEGFESEGVDRSDLQLTGRQNELISAVAVVNPNTIVVLNVGSPVIMPWLKEVKAVLLMYYPGLEGGNAIARILTGEVNPSGKLTVTFPKCLHDTPAFINYPGTKEVHYGEGIFIGYRFYDTKDVEPLFPFGFGLSYTQFTLNNLEMPQHIEKGKSISINVQVTNIGSMPGKEIIQLYVHDPQSNLPRPYKELKSFQKITLEVGESKTINFILDQRSLAYYDPYQNDWIVDSGIYEIMVGNSSRGIFLSGTVQVD